ncbi:hypothetical protein BIV57_10700 [Mangrovactinospora gilvigrisea]|uniref:HTH tetR-type domain-containing protein n=1 Tax=Mangrovactinospora gilvigrisea TaxID=1428644 RepID=A0A1J7BFZ4_9ACTN|nr:TetR/AcrR family transcriptional regulator [Mangrovactinospora gilvigrisea]OIV37501.1 hypothetical protein BIV57_10700 [Mangrovactinospora gilvigrisea]
MTATQPATRPGGRSARVREAVFKAAQELAAEQGTEKLTLPCVATRAGVNPTTLYRRWGSMAGLLADIAATRIRHTEVPDTGSLAGDLGAFAEAVLQDLRQPGGIAILSIEVDSDLRARRDGLRRCRELRTSQLEQILDQERRRNGGAEPGLTVERINDRLVAPLYYRVLHDIPGADAAYARGLAAELTD